MENSKAVARKEVGSVSNKKVRTKKKLSAMRKKDYFWAYIMIAPTFIGLSIFNLWPMIQSFYLSFTDWDPFAANNWVGLENYQNMGSDPDFALAIKNTFIFTFVSVPLVLVFALLIAVLLNRKIKGISIYRMLYFLPVVTMPVAVGMVWKWIYNGEYGLLNYVLNVFSIEGERWLTNPDTALYAVIVVHVWSFIGYHMIIFLSGLQGISKTYYEAAEIDGAGSFTKLIKITIPILSPVIFFAMIISFIQAFQMFELLYMMIGADNLAINSTQTLLYLFYAEAFVNNEKGYAAALVVLLFLIILVMTVIQFIVQKKWVHYE